MGRKYFALSAGGLAIAAALALAAPANAASGELKRASVVRDGEATPMRGADGVAVSPDGRHVYVAAHFSDSVVAFKRNPATGKLKRIDVERNGDGGVTLLDGPRGLAISPDGRYVYVAVYVDSALVAFRRNAKTGKLSLDAEKQSGADGITLMGSPLQVAVSPDNRHVYVTSGLDDAVAWFERNGTELTGAGEIASSPRHDNATGVAVSPDGDVVAVSGADSDTVALYGRGPDGDLVAGPNSVVTDGVLADGLRSPVAVAFSPDGRLIYALGHDDDALAVLERSEDDELDYVTHHSDGSGSPMIDGLVRPYSLAVVGRNVYTTAWMHNAYEGSLAMFSRDLETGAATFLGSFRDDLLGVHSIGGARHLAASPDGAHIYVAAGVTSGDDDNAVTTFRRDQPLKLKATGAKKQKAKRLAVKVRCSTPCKVTARAKGSGLKSKLRRVQLAAKRPKRLPLKLPKGKIANLGKAKVKVKVTARDRFGERKKATRTITVSG